MIIYSSVKIKYNNTISIILQNIRRIILGYLVKVSLIL